MTEGEWNLIPVLIVGLLTLTAGYSAAKRKGRAAGAWALVCGIFAPLLIVLELLPSRRAYNDPERRTWPGILEWLAIIAGAVVISLGAILTDPSGSTLRGISGRSHNAPFASLGEINKHQIPFPAREKDTLARLLRAETLKNNASDAIQIAAAKGEFAASARELEDNDICVDDQIYGYQVIKLHKCSNPDIHYMVTVLVNKNGTFSDPIYYGN